LTPRVLDTGTRRKWNREERTKAQTTLLVAIINSRDLLRVLNLLMKTKGSSCVFILFFCPQSPDISVFQGENVRLLTRNVENTEHEPALSYSLWWFSANPSRNMTKNT
jgi:hypothetical protein